MFAYLAQQDKLGPSDPKLNSEAASASFKQLKQAYRERIEGNHMTKKLVACLDAQHPGDYALFEDHGDYFTHLRIKSTGQHF